MDYLTGKKEVSGFFGSTTLELIEQLRCDSVMRFWDVIGVFVPFSGSETKKVLRCPF